jgi:hypothetical protein
MQIIEETKMVKQIIKEAMDKNPIGLKEALQEELKARIALALETKMDHSDMDDEDEMEDNLDEAKLLSKEDFARMVAKTTPKTADRYDQISAIKSAISMTPQKRLATDREFIDSILVILHNKYKFKA